jgi:hypothetical protein
MNIEKAIKTGLLPKTKAEAQSLSTQEKNDLLFNLLINEVYSEKEKREERQKYRKLEEAVEQIQDEFYKHVKGVELQKHKTPLNLPDFDMGGSISLQIKNAEYSIRISDCSNKIVLHGTLDSKEAIENAIHKANIIKHSVNDFLFNLQTLKNQKQTQNLFTKLKAAKAAIETTQPIALKRPE